MEKQHGFIKGARKYGKQAAVSLVMMSALVLGSAQQASAKIYSLDTFMSQEAKNIQFLAHPTADYVSSSYKGNGVLAITYRSPWTGDYLTLRVQGEVNGEGHFESLSVLSDQGLVDPFTVMSVLRSSVATYIDRVSKQAQDSDTRRMFQRIYPMIASGNGRNLCEAVLVAESYLHNF